VISTLTKAVAFVTPALLITVLSSPARSQPGPGKLSVSNRWISTRDADASRTELSNWLDVLYRYESWRGGFRLEGHDPNLSAARGDRFSQRYLEFSDSGIKIRAGNFYERLGRGLVFHAYEIQNQVVGGIEQTLSIDRNIDGVNAKLVLDRLDVTAIWGRPIEPGPGIRGSALGGGEIRFFPSRALTLGATYLRSRPTDVFDEAFSLDLSSFELNLSTDAADLYVEFARKESSRPVSEPHGRAFYAALSVSGEVLGLSAEFKRYRKFLTPFNNPPSLVRTHNFVLLNRHTHTLNVDDETGFQTETYYYPNDRLNFTLHASGAESLDDNPRRRFREYFVEMEFDWERSRLRALLDYSQDRPVGDLRRWTGAFELEREVDRVNSVLGNLQIQQIRNENSGTHETLFLLMSYSRSPWLTVSVQNEWSNRPDSPRDYWLSGILNLKVGQHHDFLFTLGSQPAGLVCSGGICFFVPDFRGASLRWNARL